MPDVAELGRRVKAKYPQYANIDDAELGRRVRAKYPQYAHFTDMPAPAAEAPGFLEDMAIGVERGYRRHLEPAISSLAEVTEGIKSGNFGPALQMAKEAARGTINALTIPDPKIVRDAQGQQQLQVRPPDPVLQEAQRQRVARYAASPEGRRSAARLAELDVRAGQDPSMTGKAVRGTSEFLTGAGPTLAAAIASRGSLPVIGATTALQSAGSPAQIGPQSAANLLPVPVGQAFRAGINSVRRTFGKGAAQIVEADALPAATARIRESIGEAPALPVEAPPASSIESVFAKLETDNVEQIGAMIANANRRFRKSSTPAERQSSLDDYDRLNQLTPDDQRALSQVLPARSYEPVGEFPQGGYSRNITDIPADQPNAQLDANLRELEAFFTQEGRATAPRISAETGAPAPGSAPAISARGASISGPSATAPLDALSVAPGRVPPVPPGDVPTGFGGAAPRGQQALFDAAAKSKWQDTVLAYYRANLLTNPVGRALDLGQTVINQFVDAAVRPIAAAADTIVGRLTGKRSILGPSLRASRRAFGSTRQGLEDAREVFRTGRQTIDSGADDVLYGSEIRTGLKAADVPINGMFRFLGALDAPFRRFGFARNLYDRAKVAAVNEAKAGKIPRKQIDARTTQFLDHDDIIKAAVRDGEKAVFSEPNKISSWIAEQTKNSPNARLAFGLIQPFMRIPLNAVLKAADFSGIAGVKVLYKIARGSVRRGRGQSFFRNLEEQRVFAQNVAAGSFAPAAFILGMELEGQGKLEGYFYTSKKDFPQGRVPTSIHVGGEDYDINRLGGFIAAPLFVGATYNRLRREGSDKANALLRSFSGLAQQAPALGYYGAPAKVGRILTADEPGSEIAKEAGSITSGFIPARGLLGATAKAIDPVKKRKAEGLTGPIMNALPWLREQLPAAGSSPVDAAIEKNQPLFTELQRLNKRVSELRKKDGEKDDAFKARVQQFGQNYTKFGQQLLNSPRFQAAPDALKAIALDVLNNRAKGITHREFAYPELELDANVIMDAAEQSKKNPANQ